MPFRHGISRVVVGLVDPDPRVSGQGIAQLRQNGVQVDLIDSPQVERLCRAANAHFLHRVTAGRPHCTVWCGFSDLLAAGDGNSKRQMRRALHSAVAGADVAILVNDTGQLQDSAALVQMLPAHMSVLVAQPVESEYRSVDRSRHVCLSALKFKSGVSFPARAVVTAAQLQEEDGGSWGSLCRAVVEEVGKALGTNGVLLLCSSSQELTSMLEVRLVQRLLVTAAADRRKGMGKCKCEGRVTSTVPRWMDWLGYGGCNSARSTSRIQGILRTVRFDRATASKFWWRSQLIRLAGRRQVKRVESAPRRLLRLRGSALYSVANSCLNRILYIYRADLDDNCG